MAKHRMPRQSPTKWQIRLAVGICLIGMGIVAATGVIWHAVLGSSTAPATPQAELSPEMLLPSVPDRTPEHGPGPNQDDPPLAQLFGTMPDVFTIAGAQFNCMPVSADGMGHHPRLGCLPLDGDISPTSGTVQYHSETYNCTSADEIAPGALLCTIVYSI